MRLSDYKGEQAIEILGDIIEPFAHIMADEKIQKMFNEKDKEGKKVVHAPIEYVKVALKNHQKEIIEILATVNGQTYDEYAETVNIFTLPGQILELVNDPQFKDLFTSQRQMPDN